MKTLRPVVSFILERNIHWMELVLLAGIGLAVYCSNLAAVPFFRDESTWIWTSRGLEEYIQGDFHAEVWNPVEPPMTGFIIGVGRRLGGYHVQDLNGRWRKPLGYRQNAAAGNVPSDGLLWISRLPMAILAVLGVEMGAFLVAKGYARGSAYLFSALFFWNLNYGSIFRRAMNESPLLFFTLIGGVLGYVGLIAWPQKRIQKAVLFFALLGVAAGLAAAIKTNGLGVMAAGVSAVLGGMFLREGSGIPSRRQLGVAASIAAMTAAATVLTFFATNPYLYGSPIGNTQVIFERRGALLREQQSDFPDSLITTENRWKIVPERIFSDYTSFSYPGHFFINFGLCIIGLMAAASLIWRRVSGWEAQVMLLCLALFCAGPALFTPIDWDRYYMYPVVFARVYISIGVFALLGLVLRRLADWLDSARSQYRGNAAPEG